MSWKPNFAAFFFMAASSFVVSPPGCREQEQPQEDLNENPATPWVGVCDIFEMEN